MMVGVLQPKVFFRLLSADAMSISREPMLIIAAVMSVLPAIAFALGRGAIDGAALSLGFEALTRSVGMVVLVLPAILIGWVTGFLLLEDRDDGVLMAVEATPIGKEGFLLYRVTASALLGACITAGAVAVVVPELELAAQLAVVLSVALEAAIAALILPAVARNKVEGLALTKLTNIAAVVPLLVLLPSPLRLLAGVVPTYWIGEALAPNPLLPLWAVCAASLVVHGACLLVLMRLVRRRAG